MTDIQRKVVNGINTVQMHGKNYVEVAERVRLVHDQKREFEVIESSPFTIGERCIWKTVVKVDGKLYTGNAEVKLNASSGPDKTNPFECGETSALGRALAFAGFGSVESIASFDEVYRATNNGTKEQAEPQEPSVDDLKALCVEVMGNGKWGAVRGRVLNPEEVGDVPDEMLSREQKSRIYQALMARKQKGEQAQKAS